jgi:hypothetical protein
MEIILIAIIITIIILLSISLGIYLSYKITDTTEYILFWFMYILSVLTLCNIGGGLFYYSTLKNKVGPRGPRGPQGDDGDSGEYGQCSVSCRNNSCQIAIKQKIIDTINELERSYGDPGTLTVDTDLRNPYIKEKIKAICNSEEYQQMAPIKGVEALIKYLESIWVDITTRLYNSGGVNYFRTIGAEYDWDWLDENPWDEFKKYDVYYWGMGKEYRPRIIEEEIIDTDGVTQKNSNEFPDPENRKTGSSEMVEPGEEMKSTTEQKDVKYSILAYVNIPTTEADGKTILASIKGKPTKKIKLYNVHTFTNSEEILSQYSTSRNIRYLNPLSFMVVSSVKRNDYNCIKYNEKEDKLDKEVCNSYEPDFIFHIEMDSKPEGRLMDFKLKHTATELYLKFVSSTVFKLDTEGTVLTFAKE